MGYLATSKPRQGWRAAQEPLEKTVRSHLPRWLPNVESIRFALKWVSASDWNMHATMGTGAPPAGVRLGRGSLCGVAGSRAAGHDQRWQQPERGHQAEERQCSKRDPQQEDVLLVQNRDHRQEVGDAQNVVTGGN